MAERISNLDIEGIVYLIQGTAQKLELLPTDAYLTYSPGSVTKGYSAEVGAYFLKEEGRSPIRVRFLPEWTYKTTRKELWGLLNATYNALTAVENRK